MRRRVRVAIQGAVQGVGFRPFVFRLADELGLAGTVANDARGVLIEAEGEEAQVRRLLDRLRAEHPTHARIDDLAAEWLDPTGRRGFAIAPSAAAASPTAAILPDLALCADCRREILDPADRRHAYPFTNCTRCGPRFTILRALPYDRPNTTMARFAMCAACRAEYDDPRDRRFHAQPNACPACGPVVSLVDRDGVVLARGSGAIARAAGALAGGAIVAVEGLGGFHLMVDARDGAAVAALRQRKARWHKPLALMVRDLDVARTLVEVGPEAAALLACAAAPIVLLERRPDAPVAPEVAPDTPRLGLLLPYTPLHVLLLRDLDFPLVATSGNLSEEPICIDPAEARQRLGGVADLFLTHDRPIERHADDSVVLLAAGAPRLVRRARGYAPLPVRTRGVLPPILALGAQQKAVVALACGSQVVLSQHIGDLDTPAALATLERTVGDLLRLYASEPVAVAHDLHPDYAATRWATAALHGPFVGVQHHHAHLASCLADNGADGPALGVTWDGTGYGPDGTVWGGEFLLGDASAYARVATLRPFRLPGGEQAVREPRRVALALLFALEGERALERDDVAAVRAFSAAERRVLARMLRDGVHAPVTTSAGRLFDGIAALLGLHLRARFDGQAAMALEHAAAGTLGAPYPLPLVEGPDRIAWLDWRPLVEAVLADLGRGAAAGAVSARFHAALAEAVVAVARRVGVAQVALSGGCFQNRLLLEGASARLRAAGFSVLLHRQVPPNDGGIALGQVLVAAARLGAPACP